MTVEAVHGNFSVLMVHSSPCIRMFKEAQALRQCGVNVDLLCMHKNFIISIDNAVCNVYKCETLDDMHAFLLERHTQWDIIHCHNEPNTATIIALGACTKRPVIYDCHDMTSARSVLADNEAAMEKLCFTRSQGVVHVSDGLKKLAHTRYGPNLSIVLPSLPLACGNKIGAMPKLQGNHVVYQGGLVASPASKFSYRFYLPMFRLLLDAGLHVHVFPRKGVSPVHLEEYAKLAAQGMSFHLYSSLPYDELITTMSQFQWGFSGFNMAGIDSPTTVDFLNSALPNKFFDYLLAGVCPVVINNATTADFATKHGVGYAARDMQEFADICTNRTPLPPMKDLSAIDLGTQIERLLGLYRAAIASMP